MSNMDILLAVFIIATAVAVIIQACILIALFVTVRKSTKRMEALAEQMQTRALPLMETAQSIVTEYRPKVTAILDTTQSAVAEYRPQLDTIVNNATEISTIARKEVESLQQPVAEVVERVRMQVARVDEMVNRTLTRVEDASETVAQTVSKPAKQASGVVQAVTVGIATFLGRSNYARAKKPTGTPKDEMFI